jgi:hypothetical protein
MTGTRCDIPTTYCMWTRDRAKMKLTLCVCSHKGQVSRLRTLHPRELIKASIVYIECVML